jgi:hypothetical protein
VRLVFLTTNMARGGAETQVARLAIELRHREVSLAKPTAFQQELARRTVAAYEEAFEEAVRR